MLFEGTLRQNLDLLNVYSDQEIWDVLANVSLKSKVLQLNNALGYEVRQSSKLKSQSFFFLLGQRWRTELK